MLMMTPLYKNIFPSGVTAFTTDAQIDFTLNHATGFNQQQNNFLSEYFSVENLVTVKQVHGNRIICVDQGYDYQRGMEEADGIICNLKDVPIAIRTADCLPILIYDAKTKTIGVVHAGWKGTQLRVVVEALQMMQKRFGTGIKDLRIAFGPAIRSCCYEVGKEFLSRFPNETILKEQQYCFNLPLANLNQLINAGIDSNQVVDCQICTCCNREYFSHRRDAAKAGRMISVMMIQSKE